MTRYSADRRNAAGAVPVYIVATPPVDSAPPNAQNNINGAIPIKMVAANTINAKSGAIPVRVVAGAGAPDSKNRWSNDQGLDTGAIPVFNSVSPKAMPVWRVN